MTPINTVLCAPAVRSRTATPSAPPRPVPTTRVLRATHRDGARGGVMTPGIGSALASASR